MTWPREFEHRLRDWNVLRDRARELDQISALRLINQWWWRAPWCAMSLCWQDQDSWPDPWILLSKDGFCDLARALGMSYTVIMLPGLDLTHSELRELAGRDIVSVSGERYILNWSTDIVIDMPVISGDPGRRVSLHQLKSRLN